MLLTAVTDVLMPVFAIVAVGWAIGGRIGVDLESLTELLLFVAVPALALDALVQYQPQPTELGRVAAAAVFVMVATGSLGAFAASLLGVPWRAMVLSSAFMNAGNFGLPFALLAWGKAGLAVAVLYYLTMSITHNSLGIWIARGDAHGWREIFRLPLPYAVAAGLGLAWGGLAPPLWLAKPIEMLGQMAIPLMLFSLGMRLRSVTLGAVRTAVAAVLLRMCGGVSAGWLFTSAFGIGGLTGDVIVFVSSMPTAVLNFVLAQRYGADSELVATSILLSTVATVASVPLLLSVL